MFERSDETLIAQALKGKKSAWLTLVKRYEKNLYNYALRMVNNPTDAMDLMQDIFIALFRNLSKFRGECPFKNWLFKIAHYRCLEFYRRKRPMQSLDDVPEQEDVESVCLERNIQIQQQSSALLEAMQHLPIKQKLVVELKFFQECTFEDISQQLGISTNTAKSQLYSALDKLKLQLVDDPISKVEVEYV
ncbi:RNA polymerase sigma factor [Colwellia psychrerythraea]|uniref:RNA polymerase, sigma-24 subunit, RpoE, ECF subfamily n=1 Tax=Colwellia psychrerythraea TaxID=28229 RepID=A0A099KSQ7_COLPS|nr:sigma-70 family RNA polymerase sigma factor [Colwellia psychrerythraea]KGJ93235.1 RNA polymerase, sigma-24 subunit, RpoE, ECF subfamily [Colwellia psychrerythraea]